MTGVSPSREPSRLVVVICRANQARSPLAARMLARQAESWLGRGHRIVISSAGLSASDSSPALPTMTDAARSLGVDLTRHRARSLDPSTLRKAALVITMSEAQRSSVSRLLPGTLAKSFTLKELVRIGQAAPPVGPGLADLVLELHRSRALVPAAPGPEDVADPEALSLDETAAVAREIAVLTEALGPVLFNPPSMLRAAASA